MKWKKFIVPYKNNWLIRKLDTKWEKMSFMWLAVLQNPNSMAVFLLFFSNNEERRLKELAYKPTDSWDKWGANRFLPTAQWACGRPWPLVRLEPPLDERRPSPPVLDVGWKSKNTSKPADGRGRRSELQRPPPEQTQIRSVKRKQTKKNLKILLMMGFLGEKF